MADSLYALSFSNPNSFKIDLIKDLESEVSYIVKFDDNPMA